VGKSRTNEITGEPEWVEVSDAAAAIEEGQELYDTEDYTGAIAKWEQALKLGGSGTKRDRAKPAELSFGEKQAVYYNTACAHAALGDPDSGLKALEAALKEGYCSPQLYGIGGASEQHARLMRDAGLAKLAEDPRFQPLVGKYKVTATEMQIQTDPSQSSVVRALKMMWGKK